MADESKIIRIGRGETEKEIPDLYINSVSIVGSLYEFMFSFGLKTIIDKDPETSVRIRMSPQHAKVFAKILIKNVNEYEKAMGEIKLPEQLLKELGIE